MSKKQIILLIISTIVILGLISAIIIIKDNEITPDNQIEGVNTISENDITKI